VWKILRDQIIGITKEFIEENQKLDRTRQLSRNGGPYTEHERTKRRNEVFKLHFEYGYSAQKIAEMMKINRHTINCDINYWYSKLSNQWQSGTVEAWYMKQVHRLEIQRTRLLEQLEKQNNFHDQLDLERMIYDIDSRLMQTSMKMYDSRELVHNKAVYALNNLMKDHKLDWSFISGHDLIHVRTKTGDKIKKMIDEDWNAKTGSCEI